MLWQVIDDVDRVDVALVSVTPIPFPLLDDKSASIRGFAQTTNYPPRMGHVTDHIVTDSTLDLQLEPMYHLAYPHPHLAHIPSISAQTPHLFAKFLL